MSSTQEKLVDIINGFTENENLVESSWCDEHKDGLHGRLEVGQQHYIIKQLTQLIDSAKREVIENHPIILLLHELDDTLPEGKYSTITMQYMPGGKAKLEQSEESE